MDTRKQIVEAMFALMSKYPIEKITVDMIAEECTMSRASFYRYYQDKYQLMTMTYVFYTDKMIKEDVENCDWAAALEKVLRFMRDNRRVFENMFKIEGQDSFFKFLYAHNLNKLREIYMKIKGARKLSPYETHMMEFYISGMVHFEEQWITRNVDLSPREVAQIILDGMPDVIKAVLVDMTK